MSTVWNLEAELDDGAIVKVVADQRDLAAFECEPFGVAFYQYQARPMTFLRYLAWHAGKRQKVHTIATYDAWGDQCVRVSDLDEGGAEAPEVDPMTPVASAGT